jgi:phage-related protein
MQQKFAALFVMLGNVGKIFNEQKFKHLSGTDQLFEFKADQGRVLCFFFVGKRVILTHGFAKKSDKAPTREIEKAEKVKVDFTARSR